MAARVALCLLASLGGCRAGRSGDGGKAPPANSPIAQFLADSATGAQPQARAQSAADSSAIDDGDVALKPTAGALTAVAMDERFVETVAAIGVVTPRPGHYAEVSAPAAARVAHVYVAVGDRVAAGAPVVDFEPAPFDDAVASADAALTMARHAADRAQHLSAEGTIGPREVDQASADVIVAESAAASARRIRLLARLRAPMTGVVTHLSAVPGTTADASRPLIGIADLDSLDVVFSLSPAEAAGVQTGDTVAVTTGTQADGDLVGTAIVTARDTGLPTRRDTTRTDALSSAMRTVVVRARIIAARPAPAATRTAMRTETRTATGIAHGGGPLRIGESVFGRIEIAVVDHATTVPVQALVQDAEGREVFVVGPDGRAHARPVVVRARTETTAEISDGLHPGERVLIAGVSGVKRRPSVASVR